MGERISTKEPRKRWFVLLVQDGSECVTQVPQTEAFFTEKEAIAFAKESATQDTDGGEGAVYHVMRTTHFVWAKRRITTQIAGVK